MSSQKPQPASVTMIAAAVSAAAVGFDALRENPLRTLLSTLGVIIGVAVLVAVLSLGDALQAFSRGELERITDVRSITIEPRTWHLVDGQWEPVRNPLILTPANVQEMERQLPSARAALLSRSGSARIHWPRSGRELLVNVVAVSEGIVVSDNRPLAAGRSFTSREMADNAPVVVVSWNLAEELAGARGAASLVGEQVRVGPRRREVIGVFAPRKGERGYAARIPYSGAAATFGNAAVTGPPSVALIATSIEATTSLASEIQDWLALRFRDWEARAEVVVAEAQLAEVSRGFLILKLFLGALAGISMLVGGIGIMNIMLASVTERTREIGIRKAVGASARDIRLQFLAEAIAIAAVGSCAGVLVGLFLARSAVAIMRAMVEADGLHLVVAPSTLLLSAGTAVVVGLVFGTYPARRASQLSPIDAIRHE